jgi:Lon protease-like protein
VVPDTPPPEVVDAGGGETFELAMFPLGSVLFPSVLLPLHVFEPRYRAMTRHCLDATPEFGVVLIERGHEVGGGDVRTPVGTVARIVEAAELDDGRWVLATVGTRRIRVVRWLEDAPWPRALVAEVVDEVAIDDDAAVAAWVALQPRLRRVLALASELGEAAAPVSVELAEDPGLGSFQAAALAPIGPSDHQRVLNTSGPDDRLALLDELLTGAAELLEARLAMGGDIDDDDGDIPRPAR